MSDSAHTVEGLARFAPANEFVRWTDGDIEQSISQSFEKQAELRAGCGAVRANGAEWSYAELNRMANRIAHGALEGSSPAAERIALLLPHDVSIIAAMLGVLKAGRVCVPLSPAFPDEHLRRLLANADADIILTNAALRERVSKMAPGREVLDLDSLFRNPQLREDNPSAHSDANAVAFIIYTSGSTGDPRGVIQTHRNILHNVRRHTHGFHYGANDRLSLLASPTSAQGMATVFCGLLNGAALCLRDIARETVHGLGDWLRSENITAYVSAASVFRHFAATLTENLDLPDLRVVRLASESVLKSDLDLFQKWFPPHCLFANTYSSTETGNLCQFFWDTRTPLPGSEVPVGLAMEGMSIRLLNELDEPVPAGSVGEVVVQSRYLSPGYWNVSAAAQSAFRSIAGSEERLYFTGDLARWRPDGLLEHAGRKQHVKIRGFRVYPEEVRQCLRRHPAIADAAVEETPDAFGASQLVAYFTTNNGAAPDARELRAYVSSLLPDFMAPAHYVLLNEFPRTPNGKIDRRAIRELGLNHQAENAPIAPARTANEELIAGVFAEVLGREAVGVDDNFFELGGDSLLIGRLAVRLEEALRVRISLQLLFEKTTPAALNAALSSGEWNSAGALTQILAVPRDRPLPLSFSQERNWRQSQSPEGAIANLLPNGFELEGLLDVAALERGLNEVVRRHESLRSTFPVIGGEPKQVIGPGRVPFRCVDLSGRERAGEEANRIWLEEARTPIDLASGPLLRATLIRLEEQRHWLLLTYHHIVFDAWARDNLLRELAIIYAALSSGRESPLPDLALHYADFAVWQRDLLRRDGPVFHTQLAYWKRQLAGAPSRIHLPCEYRKPRPSADLEASKLRWSIAPDLARRLRELGRRESATLFMTRLTAFAAHLRRVTGEDDPVIASYIMNRSRPETHEMIGFFSNLVLLRIDAGGNPSFRELLARVRQTTLEATAHADLPFEELKSELERGRVSLPKPRVIFEIKYGEREFRLGDVRARRMDRKTGTMPWRLQFGVEAGGDQAQGQVLFDATRYDATKVREFAEGFTAALAEFAADPQRRIGSAIARRKWWRLFG